MRRAALDLRPEAERARIASRVGADPREQGGDLLRGDAPVESKHRDAVAVETLGEVAEQTVAGVRGDPVDHELALGDAEAEGAPLGENAAQGLGQPLRRGNQDGMAFRVGRLVSQGQRELDQQIRDVPGKRDSLTGDQVSSSRV